MIEEMMRRELVRYIVQRSIFCPVSGVVLDMDTCTVILDSDGDPAFVVAPSVGKKMKEMLDAGERVLAEGYTLDETTLR